jgi:hypothetical protein
MENLFPAGREPSSQLRRREKSATSSRDTYKNSTRINDLYQSPSNHPTAFRSIKISNF